MATSTKQTRGGRHQNTASRLVASSIRGYGACYYWCGVLSCSIFHSGPLFEYNHLIPCTHRFRSQSFKNVSVVLRNICCRSLRCVGVWQASQECNIYARLRSSFRNVAHSVVVYYLVGLLLLVWIGWDFYADVSAVVACAVHKSKNSYNWLVSPESMRQSQSVFAMQIFNVASIRLISVLMYKWSWQRNVMKTRFEANMNSAFRQLHLYITVWISKYNEIHVLTFVRTLSEILYCVTELSCNSLKPTTNRIMHKCIVKCDSKFPALMIQSHHF